jgi:hypothetical protein
MFLDAARVAGAAGTPTLAGRFRTPGKFALLVSYCSRRE